MEERQHAEHAVALADGDDRERGVALGHQIGVRQHDALQVGGGAGRVEDDRRRAGVARPARQGGRGGSVARRGHRRVDVESRDARHGGERLVGGGAQPLAGEQDAGAGVGEDGGDLRAGVVGVEGDDDGAGGEDGEVGGAPVGVVVGQDGAAVAGLDAGLFEPAGAVEREAVQVGVGEAVQPSLRCTSTAVRLLWCRTVSSKTVNRVGTGTKTVHEKRGLPVVDKRRHSRRPTARRHGSGRPSSSRRRSPEVGTALGPTGEVAAFRAGSAAGVGGRVGA